LSIVLKHYGFKRARVSTKKKGAKLLGTVKVKENALKLKESKVLSR